MNSKIYLDFLYHKNSLEKIFLYVIFSSIPGLILELYFFGFGNLIQIIISLITSTLIELFILKIKSNSIKIHFNDYTSFLTSFFLGISFPPLSPWWLITLATLFAIVLGKHLYGGFGQNIFNPAMIGYITILIFFPQYMNIWVFQISSKDLENTLKIIFFENFLVKEISILKTTEYDTITHATPLSILSYSIKNYEHFFNFFSFLKKNTGNILHWILINIVFLLGGFFLIWKNLIRWRIPLTIFLTLSILSIFGWMINEKKFIHPLFQLFCGGTMLGVFFISTDPITSTINKKGCIIFGFLIGFITWIIRSFTNYPDGIAFAIILTNFCVPTIDYYTLKNKK